MRSDGTARRCLLYETKHPALRPVDGMNRILFDADGQPIEPRQSWTAPPIKWTRQNWGFLVSTTVALVALGVGISNSRAAKDNNRIAREALSLGEDRFYKANCPYLVVHPVMSQATQEYYKHDCRAEDLTIVLMLKYKVENVGNAPAGQVRLPEKTMAAVGDFRKEAATTGLVAPITLGPGEIYFQNIVVRWRLSDEASYRSAVREVNEGKMPLTVQLAVLYQNGLRPSDTYRTTTGLKVYKKDALILKSEYMQLPKDAGNLQPTEPEDLSSGGADHGTSG